MREKKKPRAPESEDEELLRKYVAAIGWREWEDHFDPFPGLTVKPDEDGRPLWRPTSLNADAGALKRLYAALGLPGYESTRFPPLYELFISTYRWGQVDLDRYTLLPNPPGPDLTGLAEALRRDKGLFETLVPNGYFQFAKGPDVDYDPVCFDFRNRQQNGDCRIVKLDHEEILCNFRIREACELAPNFRTLVRMSLR